MFNFCHLVQSELIQLQVPSIPSIPSRLFLFIHSPNPGLRSHTSSYTMFCLQKFHTAYQVSELIIRASSNKSGIPFSPILSYPIQSNPTVLVRINFSHFFTSSTPHHLARLISMSESASQSSYLTLSIVSIPGQSNIPDFFHHLTIFRLANHGHGPSRPPPSCNWYHDTMRYHLWY